MTHSLQAMHHDMNMWAQTCGHSDSTHVGLFLIKVRMAAVLAALMRSFVCLGPADAAKDLGLKPALMMSLVLLLLVGTA